MLSEALFEYPGTMGDALAPTVTRTAARCSAACPVVLSLRAAFLSGDKKSPLYHTGAEVISYVIQARLFFLPALLIFAISLNFSRLASRYRLFSAAAAFSTFSFRKDSHRAASSVPSANAC